ncbi:hypothetical protein [Bowmanella sp. JS7-9]|uniref:N-formylglutamate amidohydrolase n=1 Tax=Pseudobowmanella zhangzhouensis TaxID=1537679 RepID=A0ABW1XIF8_9ALTE|nr:hypothetical protein [Bowmanella sp. JS7-9]TBX21382.1 hypothetical protein TK45_12590 [Bowmanella sp. JS7-9]
MLTSVGLLALSQSLLFAPQPDISLEITSGEQLNTWVFFAPHQNENIANQYLANKVTQTGGKFVRLQQSGQRHIHLQIGEQHYEIDPNRIFTPAGREATLLKLNKDLTSTSPDFVTAMALSQQLADFILAQLQTPNWVAIHNNTQGFDDDGHQGRGTISIKRYQDKLAQGAKYLLKVHDAGQDEDDLFFITEPTDYAHMQQAGFNVVLQNPQVATEPDEDDGSLSVLAEKQGRRYINIEAERVDDDGFGQDHLTEQQQMIDFVFEQLISTTP